MSKEKFETTEAHKYFGIHYNQLVWSLLEKKERTPEEDEMMIHAAHASHIHWLKAGTKANEQRAEWILTRVYLFLNMPERAMHHALRCKKLTEEFPEEMADFDLGYAEEGIARALTLAGKKEEAKIHLQKARELGEKIKDEHDKKYFMGDINEEPRYWK